MNGDDDDDTCCPIGPHPHLLLLTGSDKVQTTTKHTRRCMQERVILMRKPFLSFAWNTHLHMPIKQISRLMIYQKGFVPKCFIKKRGRILKHQEHRDRYINRAISYYTGQGRSKRLCMVVRNTSLVSVSFFSQPRWCMRIRMHQKKVNRCISWIIGNTSGATIGVGQGRVSFVDGVGTWDLTQGPSSYPK